MRPVSERRRPSASGGFPFVQQAVRSVNTGPGEPRASHNGREYINRIATYRPQQIVALRGDRGARDGVSTITRCGLRIPLAVTPRTTGIAPREVTPFDPAERLRSRHSVGQERNNWCASIRD